MEECHAFLAAPLPPSDRTKPLTELGHDVAMMVLCLAGMNTVDIFNLSIYYWLIINIIHPKR